MQAQKFVSAFPPLKSKLLPFLTPCGAMRSLNHSVAARRGDHLLVVDVSQARDLPNRCPTAPQSVGMNDLWDSVFTDILQFR